MSRPSLFEREIVVFRKLCMLIAMALTLCGAFFVADADAQGIPTCNVSFLNDAFQDAPATPTPTPTPAPTTTSDTATDGATDTATVASAEVSSEDCAEAVAYPGPFTNMPTTPTSPYVVPRGIAAPAMTPAAPVTTTPVTGPDLAHSGSEVVVLGYLGTGLLAFGAVLLGVRRGGFVE